MIQAGNAGTLSPGTIFADTLTASGVNVSSTYISLSDLHCFILEDSKVTLIPLPFSTNIKTKLNNLSSHKYRSSTLALYYFNISTLSIDYILFTPVDRERERDIESLIDALSKVLFFPPNSISKNM